MAAKFKRHLKKEIVAGKAELPDELQFLSKANYFAVAEQRVQGVREWYVEVQGSLLKTLLDTKKKLNAARLSNRTIKSNNQTFQDEIIALQEQLNEAQATNEQLKKTLEEKVTELSNTTVKAENSQELQDEVVRLQSELTLQRDNNNKLMKNIEEDRSPDHFHKSPKNFHTIAEERGLKLVGLPIQGGLAGVEKK